jgi:hypothetical protein
MRPPSWKQTTTKTWSAVNTGHLSWKEKFDLGQNSEPEGRVQNHRGLFPDLENKWSFPGWIWKLLQSGDYCFNFHFSLFLSGNVYNYYPIYLSYHCVLRVDNLFLEFHRFIDGKKLCLRLNYTRASLIPDLDDLNNEIWNFAFVWNFVNLFLKMT